MSVLVQAWRDPTDYLLASLQGIKLVDIRLKGNQSPDLLRLLWDTDTPTSPSCRSVFFVLNPRKLAIRSGPGYRLARYLPLDNIRNLTLCFGSAGPHCVQADNGARSALGLKEDMFCFSKETGCYFVPYQSCVTYFLAPDEVITSMCVLTSKDKMSESGVDWPFIVVRDFPTLNNFNNPLNRPRR